ncbi:hypothetical protein HPB50_014800 [Hyalomma asiaticum]|uniref:Uncharacterized protein n=1 Tax=Hyalomma asiaticum TaxID=266040 RepID=A0ACB7SE15_HYAAI|nr:hypothetical protein HPB50_014800 [Hyalomma asiaticum]
MLWQCPALNASFGSPATEDEWINHLSSPDRALQRQAVQKAQKVPGELRLPVPTWSHRAGPPQSCRISPRAPSLAQMERGRPVLHLVITQRRCSIFLALQPDNSPNGPGVSVPSTASCPGRSAGRLQPLRRTARLNEL